VCLLISLREHHPSTYAWQPRFIPNRLSTSTEHQWRN